MSFNVERERQELLKTLNSVYSPKHQLFLISKFYGLLLEEQNENIVQSYLPEFIYEFVNALKHFSPFGINPKVTEDLLAQIKKISHFITDKKITEELTLCSGQIKEELFNLTDVVSGNHKKFIENKLYFPVLEEGSGTSAYNIGELDSLTIKVSKSKEQNKFIIIPSEREIEERIREQVHISFNIAVDYVKSITRKVAGYHEVIIQFDRRAGFYVGGSLGLALTIGFIEKLLLYYNAAELVSIKSNIALTGGLDTEGNISVCSSNIIKQKVEIVFFSNCNILVVPKEDELGAKAKSEELQQDFPNRKLEIIGIENLSDLLNRRNLIDIKKQNPVVRTAKYARKNWVAIILAFLLTIVLLFFTLRDFDHNPKILESDSKTLYVKNKSGKVLWTRKMRYDKVIDNSNSSWYQKVIDIDEDGTHEIILAGEDENNLINKKEIGRVVCLNQFGEEVWKYNLQDTVTSTLELLPPFYDIRIIDTVTSIGGQKQILLSANNFSSFSSAIFKLDIKTGRRVNGTLWHSGHIYGGLIDDINIDDNLEVIFVAINNGYEKAALGVIGLNELNGFSPTSFNYSFNGKKVADFMSYILFPNTDYNKLLKFRNSAPLQGVIKNNKVGSGFTFTNFEGTREARGIRYEVDANLMDVQIIIISDFRVRRDSLVAYGKLHKPFTDTPEYCQLLKDQILFWTGEKFVKREELK